MIRIAFVITELEKGGAEQCLVRVATGLDRTRFAPEVYSIGPEPKRDGSLVDQLKAANVPTHFLGEQSTWRVRRAVHKLRELFVRQQPQLVQSFLFHANVLSTWAVPSEAKLIMGVRVADPARSRMIVERRCAQRAHKIVCVSESVCDFLTRRRFPPEKLITIRNGIDVDAFQSSPACLAPHVSDDRKIVLFVGRLDPQKGVDWLIEMAPRFLALHPAYDLVLVGSGSGPILRKLGLGARADGSSRIHALGWRTDIPALLARSELLVLPSRYEGLPNVVLEAMAAGRPVLASDVEGVRETLGENAERQTVRFGDERDFLAKMDALLSSPSVRAELGSENQSRARSQFSISSMVKAYADLYANSLSSPQR